jgi:hypothetical protein
MDVGLDALRLDPSLQGITPGVTDHEEVPHRGRSCRHLREPQLRQALQSFQVGGGDRGAAAVPFVQLAQFHLEHRGLYLAEP